MYKKLGRLHVYIEGDYIAITGNWTIPVKLSEFKEIISHPSDNPNVGLYKSNIGGIEITLNLKGGKIDLTEEELKGLQDLVKNL